MSTDQRRAPWRCWRETIEGEVHCSLPIDRYASDPPPRPRRRPRRPARLFRRAHRGPQPDHPERRFVAALGLYSHAVDRGRVPSGYVQADAERFAQALVMPAEDLDASAWRTDAELAERFVAPLDQVPLRRLERAGARQPR
jgi:hypothetical protein